MFELTREVRFALPAPGAPLPERISNSFAGYPPLTGVAPYLALRISLHGDLDPRTQYVCNIREVDAVVRRSALPLIAEHVHDPHGRGAGHLPGRLVGLLRDAWAPATLHRLELSLSPFFTLGCLASELPMIRLSHRFEFSAAHRLHNPELTDEENRACYGKCNNPHGHGHNYEVQVTLAGTPDESGLLIDIPRFERLVADHVIDPFDHKHLNEEIPDFATLIPTVENIARVVYQRLKPHLTHGRTRLASVTVWETPKTWCEYSEEVRSPSSVVRRGGAD